MRPRRNELLLYCAAVELFCLLSARVGFQIGTPNARGSISVVGGSVSGSAGAGLCVVNNPPDGPIISFSGIALTDVAKFDTGQNTGMHAAPLHLIDAIGGMGEIYISNVVAHQIDRTRDGPVLRYDATSCTMASCTNSTRLSGSTIFIRSPNASAAATVATLDGLPVAGGRLFGHDNVFANLTVVYCTPAYMALHPHDWQSYDGCRV